MKYYEIIQDEQLIGVITSNNFIRYQDTNHCFICANEENGDLVEYKDILYRALWMKPINQNIHLKYIITDIIQISKEQYDILDTTLENNVVIKDIQEEETPITTPIPEETTLEVDWMRQIKVGQMSKACRKTIEEGFDMEIRGETKHFSLSTQDQLNLMSLAQMAQTQSMLPYHADGEEVVFYAAEEIQQLVDEMNAFKIYHTTYYNALKAYINSLSTIKELDAVEYGMEIPEEYKTDVLKALE